MHNNIVRFIEKEAGVIVEESKHVNYNWLVPRPDGNGAYLKNDAELEGFARELGYHEEGYCIRCHRATKRKWCSVSCWIADVIDGKTKLDLQSAFNLEIGSISKVAEADLVRWAEETFRSVGQTPRRVLWRK